MANIVNYHSQRVKNLFYRGQKVKKAYVNGKLAFAGGEIEKIESTNLSYQLANLSATSLEDYALFALGNSSGGASNSLDCFNKESTLTHLSTGSARQYGTAISWQGLALFIGGIVGSNRSDLVEAFSNNLVRSIQPALNYPVTYPSAATTTNNLIIAGGQRVTSGSNAYPTIANLYNKYYTKTNLEMLLIGRVNIATATVGDYAIFLSGANTSNSNSGAEVDAIEKNNTIHRLEKISYESQSTGVKGTTVGDYAIFAGGRTNNKYSDIVYILDKNLSRTNTNLNEQKADMAAVTLEDYAIFAGGYNGTRLSEVETFDTNMTKSKIQDLSEGKSGMAATRLENIVFLAGGYSSTRVSTVERYKI